MLKKLTIFSFVVAATVAGAQDGPPTVNGVIANPTVGQNQDIAKAQACALAYRYKVQLTKDMLPEGAGGVINHKEHSSSWETIEKLQDNALIPQHQTQYGANGAAVVQFGHNDDAGADDIMTDSLDMLGRYAIGISARVR